jgi:xanthine dehydrogenase accessory factor
VSGRSDELAGAGVPFVEATVVRCASPTSSRPGDRAIVLADGSIEGFVGGSCADTSVRLQALRALETGEPVLLRILPGEDDGVSEEPGAVVVANPCLSGGALEIFLEPRLPSPRVAIAGDAPVARALAELCGPLGFAARTGAVASDGDFAAVVASLGHGDEEAVRAGLEAGCEYVGLVASEKRGAAVLEAVRAMGVSEEEVARVRTPAGIDIGAETHPEIALSVLAELVAMRREPAVPSAGPLLVRHAPAPPAPPAGGRYESTATHAAKSYHPAAERPREAIDPVCGMTVVVTPDTPVAGDEAFCCEGCRDVWLTRAQA